MKLTIIWLASIHQINLGLDIIKQKYLINIEIQKITLNLLIFIPRLKLLTNMI